MKKIIHVDMDCFFAAVEVRDNPELVGLPVAVGGLVGNRGVICAANYEARKYGVRSALSSALAMRQCPSLRLIWPDMAKYAAESQKIQAIFHQFTDLVEPLSLDEAYLDVTDSPFFQGSATLIAREIRRQIFETTGLTASAGIAPNKFLAKVASDWKKPNGQFAVTPVMIDEFVKKLPVEKIWGVGKVTAKKMHTYGLTTCGDLQKLSLTDLQSRFGSFGVTLFDICRGVDHRQVITSRERKSVSIERTFNKDAATLDECLEMMPALFDKFQNRSQGLRDDGKYVMEMIRSLFIKIKFSDFTSTTVESSFASVNVDNFNGLLRKGIERQYSRKNMSVRLIGLGMRFKGEKDIHARNGNRMDSRQMMLF